MMINSKDLIKDLENILEGKMIKTVCGHYWIEKDIDGGIIISKSVAAYLLAKLKVSK